MSDHFLALNILIPSATKSRMFQPWLWKTLNDDSAMHSHYGALLDSSNSEPQETDTAGKEMTVLHHVNLEGLLARLDNATMLAGLEARVPYTDHHLVEQIFQLPQKHRIDVAHNVSGPHFTSMELEQRGLLRSKRMMRTLAERTMSAELAHRKKASFPTPIEHWLSHEWSADVGERLKTSEFAHVLFRPSALAELVENIPEAGLKLWPIMNLIEWGDRQFC